MPNQKIGKDLNTDADKYADVVEITLTTENYNQRISNAEDAIKKLSISTLTAVKVMDEKAKAVEDLISTSNTTLTNITSQCNSLKSSTETQVDSLIEETRTKLDQYMSDMDAFMQDMRNQTNALIEDVNTAIANLNKQSTPAGNE